MRSLIVLTGLLLCGCELGAIAAVPPIEHADEWSSEGGSFGFGQAEPCAPVANLSCGDRVFGDTSNFNYGATDVLDSYPVAVGNYSGAEIAYSFTVDATMTTELRFIDPQPSLLNLDIFVLSSESNSCTADAAMARGFNDISFEAIAGRTYYVVVDGSFDNEGAFELEVLCDGDEPSEDDLDLVPEVPEQIQCNEDRVAGEAYERLIELTELTSEETIYTTFDRIDRIASIFESCGDTWGLFPTTYRHITRRIIQAIENHEIVGTEWGHEIVLDFAGRYFLALNQALLGETPSYAWEQYYYLASSPDVSRTRAVVVAMITHLTLDLPHALVAIDSTEDDEDDYYVLGELMIEIVDDFLADLRTYYDTDAEDILHGFFFGDWIDGVYGEDTTITLNYQTIRAKAWNTRWLLQQPWGAWTANSEIYSAFWAMDGILATLDASGTI
ncbi:MAG: hypothetical protein CL928_07990 [Deltaproteobacteria bacterium]|nr:hypothetical protein [Deltaproteobacteria bacterium]